MLLPSTFQLKVMQENKGQRNLGSLSVAAEVFHLNPETCACCNVYLFLK